MLEVSPQEGALNTNSQPSAMRDPSSAKEERLELANWLKSANWDILEWVWTSSNIGAFDHWCRYGAGLGSGQSEPVHRYALPEGRCYGSATTPGAGLRPRARNKHTGHCFADGMGTAEATVRITSDYMDGDIGGNSCTFHPTNGSMHNHPACAAVASCPFVELGQKIETNASSIGVPTSKSKRNPPVYT